MRFAGSPQVASFMSDSVDHGLLGRKDNRARAKEEMQAFKSDAQVGMAQDKAAAMVEMAEIAGEGLQDQAQAQAQQANENEIGGLITSGAKSLFGGIGGGLFGGGGGATMGGSNYWDPKTGLGVAGPNFGL